MQRRSKRERIRRRIRKQRSTGNRRQGSELFLMPLGPMVAGLYAACVLDMGSHLTRRLVLTTLEHIQVKFVGKQSDITLRISCRHSNNKNVSCGQGIERGFHCFSIGPTVHTCTDDLLDLHRGDINLLSKLPYGFVGVLIGEGIYVDLHPRRA